jgi:hypothetical protein
VLEAAADHEQWEHYSRARIEEGGALSDYYPLTPETRAEYERWRDVKESQ